MSKKLNIIEAMKMPIGTLFEVILNGEEYGFVAKIIESKVASKKQLVWDNRVNSEIVVTDSSTNATFVKVQQPVSFMEAVASGKKVRVECDGYEGFKKENYLISEIFENIIYANRLFGTEVIEKAIKNFITEGKWYIEESEELEDERLS